MWPGDGAEGKAGGGVVPQRSKAVRAADQEGEPWRSFVPEAGEQVSEFLAGDGFACGIERDAQGVGWDGRFERLQFGGWRVAALRHFAQGEGPETDTLA